MDLDTTFKDAQSAFDRGDLNTAAALCQTVADTDTAHHRARHMLGAIALQQNDGAAALAHLREARALGNEHPLLDFHVGLALLSTGDAEAAATALRAAVNSNPEVAEVHHNLGLALTRAGYRDASADAFQRAVELKPDLLPAWIGWGRALIAARRYAEAEEKFRSALSISPDSVDALRYGASADAVLGRPLDAIKKLRRAHGLAPDNRSVAERLARMLCELSDFPEIEPEIRAIAERHAASAAVLAALAAYLERRGAVADAEDLAERAVAIDPNSSHAHLTLARIAQSDGRMAEARESLDILLNGDLSDGMRVAALKVLAAVLDKDGAYDAAFEAAAEANAISRELPSEFFGEHNLFERMSRYRTWDAAQSGNWPSSAPDDRPAPIFFVGFPRSGTTLVEAMLDTHPRLATAGERAWLQQTMLTLGTHDPGGWSDLDNAKIRELRTVYWAHALQVHADDAETHRIVDKMPLNIVDLPFVRRIFPEAKILVALRDPRDCLISAFMQNFTRSPEMRPFLDLAESAQYYADVMRLWLNWRSTLDLDFLEIRYEDLVDGTEACCRQILDHLGEPWNDAVLRHHVTHGTVQGIRTPSAKDAAKAVHTGAIGRWRNYEKHLAPVIPTLQPFIEAFGYTNEP